MKTKIISLTASIEYAVSFFRTVSSDKVTVYSAEAAFYIIISAVPFISLLFALFGLFLPSVGDISAPFPLPEENSAVASILSELFSQIETPPSVPLLSFSAVATLWSASRGVSSVKKGLELIYKADRRHSYLKHRLRSLLSTLVFILSIFAGTAVTVFLSLLGLGTVSHSAYFPLLFALTVTFFTFLYSSIAKRSRHVKHKAVCHIPGAVFSSVGLVVFSFFYSLYITHFPRASYIYGSLAALCLGMLWTYFSLIIIFLGAEINKALSARKNV